MGQFSEREVGMAEPVQHLLALLGLGRRAREAASLEALGFVMVNESLQVLPYRQAALWVDGMPAQVAAVSGLPQPNPQAPYTQWLARLFAALRDAAPPAGTEGAGAPRALTAEDLARTAAGVAQDWADWLPGHVLWIPFVQDGRIAAALLLAGDQPWQAPHLIIAGELAGLYGHALAALNPQRRGGPRWRTWLQRARKRRWLVAALLLIALFPIRQNALAPAEVVPKQPFLVRAPQDGVIDRMLVRPNQAVKAGTPLFNLDQTALHTRHAVARKAYDTALEEYRQSAQLAVMDDKGKLEVALRRGALEEKRLELAYTAELLGRVQVNAERDGIAVFSDVNDWQGKAVVLGERVLTLADPAQVELSVQLPAGERFDVAPGTTLSLYPNADPLSAFEATVTQVAYSAEPTRDGQAAYRIKADFAPGTAAPRIGLMGTATLHGSRVPLIYFALRRPLTLLRQWLGV
jgi:hypothetical protein